jgi:hypothetical protein
MIYGVLIIVLRKITGMLRLLRRGKIFIEEMNLLKEMRCRAYTIFSM